MKTKLLFFVLTVAGFAFASCSMNDYYDGFSGYPEYSYDEQTSPESGDNFDVIKENPFVSTSEQPVSTFSVDADGAAYAYMRRCINSGFLPDANSVRIEEFLNYFTFNYADPEGNETLAINAEVGGCPWAEKHKLIRLGLKGKTLKNEEIPDANYILLIDTSGSMSGDDRINLLKSGLIAMIDYMKPSDRIAIITYSGSVKKVLESTLVKDAQTIKNAIRGLSASGATAGGAAMKMAYEEATAHYITGGNNRIIMCTDGDFNVGVSSTEALVEMVESYLDKGIYLSIMGFGTGNFQDARMENLSNHGNGTYTYIDSEEEMMKVFVNERSHFYAVANDTKCQITFNPQYVDSYRLIGYENRVMNNEDFEDDKKDAGEIGAGQTVTALYEIVPTEDFATDAILADFDVRYKKALGEESRGLSLKIKSSSARPSDEFDFAAGIAAYGLWLRNSEYKGTASASLAEELVGPSLDYDHLGLRAQLAELIHKAASLKK
ncbi:MAG: von Willebrand factor type A domain-containing protein [Bacteroidales bacterium]|nr:von Willebrand factor type A domain-containing protein [Bacteroidales bacterium]